MQAAEEVTFQMRRINWHPSVIIWSGNNEVETALSWFEASRQNPSLYVSDYTAVFLCSMQRTVAAVAPYGLFVDSSPSNGPLAGSIKRCTLIASSSISAWGDAHSVPLSAFCVKSEASPAGPNPGCQQTLLLMEQYDQALRIWGFCDCVEPQQ